MKRLIMIILISVVFINTTAWSLFKSDSEVNKIDQMVEEILIPSEEEYIKGEFMYSVGNYKFASYVAKYEDSKFVESIAVEFDGWFHDHHEDYLELKLFLVEQLGVDFIIIEYDEENHPELEKFGKYKPDSNSYIWVGNKYKAIIHEWEDGFCLGVETIDKEEGGSNEED